MRAIYLKKLYFPLAIVFTLIGCSSSSDDEAQPELNWRPGIYTGVFAPIDAPADGVTMIITSDNRFALTTKSSDDYAYLNGEWFAIGTVSGGSLNGRNGFSANITDPDIKSNFEGTYSRGAITGTFNVWFDDPDGSNYGVIYDPDGNVYSVLYNRDSSTDKLSGPWVDDVNIFNIGTSTWTITSQGAITMSADSGCTATGTTGPINTRFNEYSLSITVENCSGADGEYVGLGYTNDKYFTDDKFIFILGHTTLETYGIFSPVLQ